MRILVDEDSTAKVVSNVTDPVVKSFWLGEFAKSAPRNIAEIDPIARTAKTSRPRRAIKKINQILCHQI